MNADILIYKNLEGKHTHNHTRTQTHTHTHRSNHSFNTIIHIYMSNDTYFDKSIHFDHRSGRLPINVPHFLLNFSFSLAIPYMSFSDTIRCFKAIK